MSLGSVDLDVALSALITSSRRISVRREAPDGAANDEGIAKAFAEEVDAPDGSLAADRTLREEVIKAALPIQDLSGPLLVCTKISAAGNDFLCIDNREKQFSFESHARTWVSKLCHRRFGLGADGVLILESTPKADLRMRVFNADGSEAAMCGNGLRAICLFAFLNGLVLPEYRIETLSGICIARIQPTGQAQALVTTTMPRAENLIEDIPLQTAKGISRVGQYLRVGVPHLLIFLKEDEPYSLEEEGPYFRNLKQFAPEGVNVHFIVKRAGKWHYRSYERGVEAETWACGSGAVAIGAYLVHKGMEKLPLVLMPFSKVPLTIGPATCDDKTLFTSSRRNSREDVNKADYRMQFELCAEALALFTLSLSQPWSKI